MPCFYLITSLFQYRPFCVPDDMLFCKSSQYKRHSPKEFTHTSGHELKIIPCYVQEVIQPQCLDNQTFSTDSANMQIMQNSLEPAATKVQQKKILPISLCNSVSNIHYASALFFRSVHVMETCLTINTQKTDLRVNLKA